MVNIILPTIFPKNLNTPNIALPKLAKALTIEDSPFTIEEIIFPKKLLELSSSFFLSSSFNF